MSVNYLLVRLLSIFSSLVLNRKPTKQIIHINIIMNTPTNNIDKAPIQLLPEKDTATAVLLVAFSVAAFVGATIEGLDSEDSHTSSTPPKIANAFVVHPHSGPLTLKNCQVESTPTSSEQTLVCRGGQVTIDASLESRQTGPNITYRCPANEHPTELSKPSIHCTTQGR